MATISEPLTEDQVDALLREAEQRLSGIDPESKEEQTSSLKLRAPKPVVAVAGVKEEPKNDKVTVRVPQLKVKKDKNALADNAGPKWYGLPQTDLTPEAKREFQILRLRGVIDPKQHFRKDNRKGMFPKFSVSGTLVRGGMEGARDSMNSRRRPMSLVDEVLSSDKSRESFQKRYDKIQEQKRQGKKAFYRKLTQQRRRR